MFSPTGFSFKVVQLKDTLADQDVDASRQRVCDIGLLQQVGVSKPGEDGARTLFQRCAAAPIAGYMNKRGLERNTEDRRCLCNGLLACDTVGPGQASARRMAGGAGDCHAGQPPGWHPSAFSPRSDPLLGEGCGGGYSGVAQCTRAARSKKGRMANHPTLLRVGEKEKT